jgi:hypothetical protein
MSRPLRDNEKNLLLFMVGSDPDATVLRAQIASAEYESAWFAGSQSFHIKLVDRELSGGDSEEAAGRSRPSHFFTVRSAVGDDIIGEVFLWTTGGTISAFEYGWFTDEMPNCLPETGQLAKE